MDNKTVTIRASGRSMGINITLPLLIHPKVINRNKYLIYVNERPMTVSGGTDGLYMMGVGARLSDSKVLRLWRER